MQDEDRVKITIAAGSIVIVGVGYLALRPTIQRERAKRAQIKEWRKENSDVVKNVQHRLMRLLDNPRTRHDEFWKALDEEAEFLKIMKKRPMHE